MKSTKTRAISPEIYSIKEEKEEEKNKKLMMIPLNLEYIIKYNLFSSNLQKKYNL